MVTQSRMALVLAKHALSVMERHWFAPTSPKRDQTMTRLLMNVYLCAHEGQPIHIKTAGQRLGVEDIKTARKYIFKAIELGLIRKERDKPDRRRFLLLPTELLNEEMADEAKKVRTELSFLLSSA